MNVVYLWPCEYCKKKFIDVRTVIYHELELCEKNPKFKYKTDLKNICKEVNINATQKREYKGNYE